MEHKFGRSWCTPHKWHPSRTAVEAGASEGASGSYSGCPGRSTEAEVGVGQGVPRCLLQRVPWQVSWSQSRCEPGGPSALSAVGALASHLKPMSCGPAVFQGALHECDFDTMAGGVVGAYQECPSVWHIGATLVGWLGLMWTRGPGLTGALYQLGCLDPAPSHTI